MPATSKAQFRLMKAAEHNPKVAKKVGIKPSVAAEYTESNVGKKAYGKLPAHKASGGGLYANIYAKQQRIAHGSGEHMRKPGSKGAPTAEAFKESAKTAKHAKGGSIYSGEINGWGFGDYARAYGNDAAKEKWKRKKESESDYRNRRHDEDDHLDDHDVMKKAKGGNVSLAIGRGEKLPASKGAGLTAKGRAKYNRETGSHLKAPQPQGGARRKSFCARMGPVARKSERGSRARASMHRWNCPGW